jgi:hypothetical protein
MRFLGPLMAALAVSVLALTDLPAYHFVPTPLNWMNVC